MTDAAKPTVGVWETIKNGCGEVGVRANGHWITFNAGDRLPVDEAESNAALIAEAGTVYQETGLTPRQLAEQRDELLAALAPFAAFAKHFPAERKFGNRPTSGVIYSMASGGMPDAEFTAEQLRAAAAIIAKVEAKP